MESLQETIGHSFRDASLLDTALTTPAYRMDVPKANDNQRLEFLGDAVLGLLSAEMLYGGSPGESEGKLTVRRARMVSSAALCAAADRIGLVKYLRRNRHATPLPSGAKTLADAVEAIIGAAYLDGGLEAARSVFMATGLGDDTAPDAWSGNPKGALQERSQSMKPPRQPKYETVSITGKCHEPVFTVRVTVEGIGEAEASAHNLKEAESLAAAALLRGS